MLYIFILGRQPALSLAEILAVLKQQKNIYKIISSGPEALIIDVDQALDVDFLISRLGGTIKIGLVKQKITSNRQLKNEDLKIKIIDIIKEKIKTGNEKKIYFGLSFYHAAPETPRWGKNKIHGLGLEIKAELERQGLKSRFVTSREPTLSSVVVKTNKLLSERGLEIIIVAEDQRSWLGQTLAVQPFEELSRRDYGRPGRDAFSGMLPPKLAKIMINLAETGPEAALLDPFCGSGTILTEAALMGYTNTFGSDLNPQAIKDTEINLKWQHQKFPISNFQFPISHLKLCDATNLSKCFLPNSFDAIVTEPYLGPPLKGRESPEQINKIICELSSLYLNALKEIRQILKPEGKIVMIWPVFHHPLPHPSKGGDKECLPLTKGESTYGGKRRFLPISEEIKKIGFQIEPLLPAFFISSLTPRGTLIYARPEQRVGREIVRLKS